MSTPVPLHSSDASESGRRPSAPRELVNLPGDFAIDLQNVTKTFRTRRGGAVHALKGIDVRVPRGSIFGLLGPNGAGKSTLVKILMTVIRASECHGRVLGMPVGHKPTLARVGYLPEHHRFPEYLTAEQILDHFGAMALVPRAERRKRIPALLELVGIGNWSSARVKGFSKGMRQRLGIANALINEPDLVLLDEPTDGVDPVGRRDIRNVLFELKRQGKTVFLNSHLLSELEMVCDTVAILVQGKVSSQGTIEELTHGSRRYEIDVGPPPQASEGVIEQQIAAAIRPLALLTTRDAAPPTARGAGSSAREVSGAGPMPGPSSGPSTGAMIISAGGGGREVAVVVDGAMLKVASDDAESVQPLIDALRRANLTVKAVRPVRESLEDLFMKAVVDPETGKELKPGAKLDGPASKRERPVSKPEGPGSTHQGRAR